MNNELLRHTVATIEYRFKLSISNYTETFGDLSLGKGSRSPIEIVNHMSHVISWTCSMILENPKQISKLEMLNIESEIERFLNLLRSLDTALANQALDMNFSKKLIQGPLSDVLTHIGQIAMLARFNDHPVTGIDYSKAKIQIPK